MILLALLLLIIAWCGGLSVLAEHLVVWAAENPINALNVLTLLLMILALLGSTVCIWRARHRVLGRIGFLFVCHPGPLSSRKKNMLVTGGAALGLFSFILILALLYTRAEPSQSALYHFISLITLECPTSAVRWVPILTFLMWIAEAAFIGSVVTLIVNWVGIGKKE